jgi:outer membrane receptor for ferrienterochelin and colicin
MKTNRLTTLILFFVCFSQAWSQTAAKGTIEGRVYNNASNEPVEFASVAIMGTNTATLTDVEGVFIFKGLQPGYVKLAVVCVGFESTVTDEVYVTNAKKAFIDVPLQEKQIEIKEVTIKASAFRRQEESPVSLRRIEISEIEQNPGGNRDISKVIASFPGVGANVSFRNDLIVRGGGPSENRFILDGVEIPNLNHFATQGASGGAAGIINVDFVRGVDFYSAAFPASHGNALSSVMEFRLIDGNPDKMRFKGSLGASEVSFTLDGPVGQKTTYMVSARRSYLQLLFAALELPFLPTFSDFQFKVKSRIGERKELSVIGIGAYDQSELNLDANKTPGQRYILGFLPVNLQWNYTFGVVYKNFRDHGSSTWVLSRNYLNNAAYKYQENNPELEKTYDYSSSEADNRIRFEHLTRFSNGIKLAYGAGLDYATYENTTSNTIFVNDSLQDYSYASSISMFNYGAFTQLSRLFYDERLSLSLGVRFDGSSYASSMSNPLKQFSPRASLSYRLVNNWYVNANAGRYYQRPPYTMLGYRNPQGTLVNQKNGIKYIVSNQFVAGLEYRSEDKYQFSVEGFYKNYSDYPFSLEDSVSLASKGEGFGIYGAEPVYSIGKGRAYGFEVLGRARDLGRFNLVLSYTYVLSETLNTSESLSLLPAAVPTSWDNRHIINITATRKFNKNWSAGAKWRFVGGAPYTPYDVDKSSIKEYWDATGMGYPDYAKFNSLRMGVFHQLDVRVDKKYFFTKWSLSFYLDIQNLYNFKSMQPDYLVRTATYLGKPVDNDPYTDENGVERYQLSFIPSDGQGTILPTVGIIVEF